MGTSFTELIAKKINYEDSHTKNVLRYEVNKPRGNAKGVSKISWEFGK